MKSPFKKPYLRAQGSRNAFDRSQKRVFHVPFGALLPCFIERVNPNDYVELSPETQTIIEPLAAPAFMRLKEHIDYFFVPTSQLWSPFDNFYTKQDQYRSSSIKASQGAQRIPDTVPTMDYSFVKGMLQIMSTLKDEHGYNQSYGAVRLLDALKYGNLLGCLDTLDDPSLDANDIPQLPNVNLFGLLAYQKVYFDYYRNPKYEECDTDAYNIDEFTGSQVFTNADKDRQYAHWFRMRYRWMKKDYFTSVQPNVLPDPTMIGFQTLTFESFSSFNDSADAQSRDQDITNVNFGVPGAPGELSTSPDTVYPDENINNVNYQGNGFVNFNARAGSGTSSVAVGSLTPARIRLMFAYDRYLRRLREAGGTYNAQMMAMYGITPNDDRFGNVIKIGGQTNRLFVNDVTNVSETGDYGLGTLGGNVNNYAQPRNKIKYHVKEPGVIIGIYSTSIDNDYPSFLISRDNTAKGRFDWFTPQFQDLGLQAMFRYELNFLSDNLSDQTGEDVELNPSAFADKDNQYDLLGYNKRYAEYKSSIDTVHGLFASKKLSPELSVWVAKWMPREYKGDVQTAPLTQKTLTYNPASLNDVTNVVYDGTPQLDQFKVHHYNHFKCISNMSVQGEQF